jgi:hypothetical protein
MELQDKPIDPQESLALIQRFIAGSRSNVKRSSFGFIFWGILIAAASILNYLLLLTAVAGRAWIAWPVLTISGFIITLVYYARNTRKAGAVSAFGRFFKGLFMCGGFTYFLLIFLCLSLRVTPAPFMLALTSLLVTVAGLALRFRPLVLGGILFCVASIASVFISPANQLLLIGVCFLLGYLVPGILLVRKEEA